VTRPILFRSFSLVLAGVLGLACSSTTAPSDASTPDAAAPVEASTQDAAVEASVCAKAGTVCVDQKQCCSRSCDFVSDDPDGHCQ
jgi:hypothetical protein